MLCVCVLLQYGAYKLCGESVCCCSMVHIDCVVCLCVAAVWCIIDCVVCLCVAAVWCIIDCVVSLFVAAVWCI